MSYLPDQSPRGLRPLIVLSEVGALVIGLSIIALSNPSLSVWLVGVIMILLHTVLFYRLGRVSERLRAQALPDFIRGLKQGLLGRRD